jgi:hypothetical protein
MRRRHLASRQREWMPAVLLVVSVALISMIACLALGMSASIGAAAALSCSDRVGMSAALPDCRSFEQVSPVEKGGFAAYTQGNTPAQASPDGEKLAYLGYQAFPGALGNTALYAAHLSTRTPQGWQTNELTPKVPTAQRLRIYQVDYAFSEDLMTSVLRVPLIPLTSGATPNAYNLVVRHPGGEYTSVNTAEPAVSVEQQCPPGELGSCFETYDISTFAGASSDFSHVIFESNAQLTAEAPPTNAETTQSLYENAGGTVRLVGILPDGAPATNSTAGGGSRVEYSDGSQQVDGRLKNAISRDGSRTVFEAPADGGSPDSAQSPEDTEVYDRLGGAETIELSAPAPGASPAVSTPESAAFWAASEDGSRVFFTSTAELTTQSNTGTENNGNALYEYNVDTRTLTDLTIDTNVNDAATGSMVQGVVEASNDGSYVYFVAMGELIPGKGVDGEPNLYLTHNGALTFITTLNAEGECSFGLLSSADACDWSSFLPQVEAYATPDGRHLAFMSTRSLSTTNFPEGYDNVDQITERPDSEVYEYTAPSASEEGVLTCATCDPTGVPPEGNAVIGGIAQTRVPRTVTQYPYNGVSTPFYKVRALSDSGTRLFYTAPGPHNHPFSEVHEYEQAGEGSCTSPGGCQYLLSDPTGGEPDRFLDASADGRDIFLASSSRLVSTDTDNVRDVYDARVDGGFATPPAEVACENSCAQPGTPQPPSSLLSGFNGPSGNVPVPATVKPKPLTRAQQLKNALRSCHKQHSKHKRARCETSARHHYGAKPKVKVRSTNSRRAKR